MSGEHVDLLVGGMTCASCAARIEKKLNRMPGVEASVNYATEKASVFLPDGTTLEQAIAVIEETGYTAERPRPPEATAPDAPAEQDPLIAGGAMALSSVFVVSNSLRLRRFRGLTLAATPAPAGSRPAQAARIG